MNAIFDNIFNSPYINEFTATQFLLLVICGLLVGLLITAFYTYRNECSQGFIITLALVPAIVSIVILTVSDNIGTGIAVAGAFSLVRFRSIPGTAKEIGAIFMAMGAGLLNGVGYVGYAVLFTLIMGTAYVVYNRLDLGRTKDRREHQVLSISIPEDLDFSKEFDDILEEYTSSFRLTRVKTTNMGSMFRLTYDIVPRDPVKQKDMIDKIRCRNGNLEVSVSDIRDDMATL
ncbi:DUF4956 domain-containing protein [Methanomethylophilus alvi]|uniref:DUF4956 domain-containing protein n=1 Tax=Methanomethylophilus alvi TaxID=1291540 RepID=UPI0037DC1A02